MRDALRAARETQQFVGNRTIDEYVADALVAAAVERKLMIVGEALWRAEKLDQQLARRISKVSDAIAFWHRLVHGYEHIDSRAVYAIVHDDLPILIRELEALLPELPAIESAPQ